MRTCIRHFEMKEIERNSEKKYSGYNDKDNDEYDILFNSVSNDNMKIEDDDENDEDDDENQNEFGSNKSFWGKERVIKSKISNYDIRMFSNKR